MADKKKAVKKTTRTFDVTIQTTVTIEKARFDGVNDTKQAIKDGYIASDIAAAFGDIDDASGLKIYINEVKD